MRHLGSEAGALVMPYASNLCDCMWAELRSISTWLEGFSPGAPVFLPYPNRLTPNITSAWLWCWALTSDMDRFRPSCALRKIQQQREDEHAQPSILFYSIPFHSIPFHSMLCYSTLLYSTLLYSTLFYSILFYSILYLPVGMDGKYLQFSVHTCQVDTPQLSNPDLTRLALKQKRQQCTEEHLQNKKCK